MASTSKVTGVDDNAIYYEVSPTIILCMRGYNVIMLLMVMVAFVICLIKGHDSATHYLLASNLVLSGLIAIVLNWWYRKKELSPDKYWCIFLLATIIIFQAITTDIYAFHKASSTPSPTTHPTIHTTRYTGTTMTWVTINKSTVTPSPRPFPLNYLKEP